MFLYNGTTALKKIYFWEPICTELPDFQSVHLYWTTRITFLFQLFTYFIIIIMIIISICQYLPHLIKRFYVAQAFYFALNTSETFISSALHEQTCWKSETYIKPQTMKLKRICRVLRLTTAEWTIMSAPLCGCDHVRV